MALIDDIADYRSYYYHGIQHALVGSHTCKKREMGPPCSRAYDGQVGVEMDWEGLDELIDLEERREDQPLSNSADKKRNLYL